MPTMIDYAFLCQAIDDWRAGRRPQLPPSATPTIPGIGVTSTAPIELYADAPEDVEVAADEGESDLVDVEEPMESDADADALAAESAAEIGGEAEAEGQLAHGEVPMPPPDYDSTMVYGSTGEPAWQQPADGEPREP
jgi:hypothetical protein